MKLNSKKVKKTDKILIGISVATIVAGLGIFYSTEADNMDVKQEFVPEVSYYITDEFAEAQKANMEVEFEIPIYDIELNPELQEYTYNKCQEYGIDYNLFMALMYHESAAKYDYDYLSNSGDLGICQINRINWEWLEKAGYTDLTDPYQNIDAGTLIFSGLVEKYGNSHQALLAYNFGCGGMRKVWKKGIRSSKYSRKVMKIKEEIFNKELTDAK